MKIGIDTRPLAYGITGNSRYLAEILKRIIPSHPRVLFYFFSNKPIHSVFSYLEQYENVIVVLEKAKIPGPIYLHFILPRRIKSHLIDRFWATLQMLPYFKLPIPTYVNYHDLNFISAPETMEKWNYWQHKLFSPRTIKNADRIFCLSANTKNEIVGHFPSAKDKCLIVYPGVEKRKFKVMRNLFPKNFFLTIGTLEPRKNIKILIDAFLAFRSEDSMNNHTLVVLGRKGWGKEGEELYQQLTHAPDTKHSIVFLENPTDDTLGQAIHECSVFFFPSHHEGFGLPLLEAMIENKRCVASDIPVFKEILDYKNDLFVPTHNSLKWKEAFLIASNFKSLTRNPKFSEKKWSWDSTTEQIEEVILT